MASRDSPGVLESTSPTTLNTSHGSHPPLKKRKLFHGSSGKLSTSVFCIKGLASSLSDDGFTLEPIALLLRSSLPFSWLDTSTPIQSGSLFAANNPNLEDDLCGWEEPTVLAARLIPNGTLYVVERVKKGIYALCRLSSCVNEGDLLVAAKEGRPSLRRKPLLDLDASDKEEGADWREAARVKEDFLDIEPFGKRRKFDVSVVFETGQSNVLPEIDVAATTEQSRKDNHVQTPPEEGVQMPQPNVEEQAATEEGAQVTENLLDSLRTQYLEALYVSKTSVAYFAKGPLTRCRNAFQRPGQDGVATSSELASFYREAILPVKKMDLKYKETLPTIIRNVALVLSEDEADSRPRKRKSKKKKKLGKNGLYPEEEDFVRKWWKGRHLTESAGSTEMTREEEFKRHISDLRLRETQLQILLILETIALESSGSTTSEEAPQEHAHHEDGSKQSKTKKPQDLNVLLELLLDRLCIWHTVSAEDAVVPDTVKDSGENHLSGKKIESDMLRDFCTEVIIPFYASRLPEQCKSIKRKLGGPNLASPTRPTAHSKSSSRAQPGTVVKRPQPQKSRRTLQRVLTDEKTAASQRGRHPSLARSSTAPSLQEIKRESAEPSLPSLSASVRGGIQIARRVDNREVDLNAVAKQHEAKLKKMNMLMEQKRELDAAINALRKPNRELIAKEIAEQTEKRISNTSSRKSKNPTRNPLGQGVQVMATPKGSRKKDVNVDLPPPPRDLARARQLDTSPALGSDISVVPASTVRPSLTSANTRREEINSIHETPSRGASRLSDPLEMMVKEAADTPRNSDCSRALFKVPNLPISRSEPHGSSSTPVSSRLFSVSRHGGKSDADVHVVGACTVQETPPRTAVSTTFLPTTMPSSPAPVMDTPVKGGGSRRAPMTPVKMTPEKSIYEQLGWDDDELAL
ncbi:hypothetical protein VTN77DRAFT_4400 [Rasamsonia byssochlamydoides]|uniref:uncharacterized protein n=1 Tax=Rasamsonia byssochlamydoides TaxID=89139 RepID=UPI003744885B